MDTVALVCLIMIAILSFAGGVSAMKYHLHVPYGVGLIKHIRQQRRRP